MVFCGLILAIFLISAIFPQSSMGIPVPLREIVHPIDNAIMILIPEGNFIYGISSEDLNKIYEYDGVSPPQFKYEVQKNLSRFLPAYYIDKYEVTNRQYAKFLRETRYKKKPKYWDNPIWNRPDYPVVGVGWNDAIAYCTWAEKRLPKEKEWEKAARGTDGRWWPWGDEFRVGNCNSDEIKLGRTVKVGKFPRSASHYGLMDMAGNVWEMVEGEENSSPWGRYVMRGGAFLSRAAFVRTTVRWSPDDKENGAVWLGFRCVKDLE